MPYSCCQEDRNIIPLYFHNLKLTNSGTITNILTDEEDRFVICYMSIGEAISNYIISIYSLIYIYLFILQLI